MTGKGMLIAILAVSVIVVMVSMTVQTDRTPIETIPNIAPEPEPATYEPDAVSGDEFGSEPETEQIAIDLLEIIPLPEIDIPDPVATVPDIGE